jgi:peptide/nickel transport system ATP-binding protein
MAETHTAPQSPPRGKPEDLLLDIRNLKIEARVFPPGETPRDVTIVDGVSLTLERGKVLGLIGESGAGKSTIGLSSMASASPAAR